MKKIGIVILHYNGESDTIECLESLSKLQISDYKLEIIIIDNGSKKKLIINDFKVIRLDENLGFAQGNNVGIRLLLKNGCDYVLILNNDTVVDKNFLSELLNTIESDKSIGIASPKIYFQKEYEFHKNRYHPFQLGKVIWYAGGIMDFRNVIGHHKGVDEVDHGQFHKSYDIDYATGACMLVKKDVFEKIGMFDEKYFLYYEDSDLCLRAKKIGYKVVFSPLSVIWHKNAGSSQGGSGSNLQDYYITRNRLLFGISYAPLRSKFALLKESISLFLSGRKWQKKGVVDFYLGRFGKGSFTD